MVDLEVLKSRGIDAEGLKKKFNLKRDKRSEKINSLVDRIRNRCQGGRDLNLEQYHVFQAIDAAWDVSMRQITPTLLATLQDKSPDSPAVLDILKATNLDPNRVIVEVPDPKTPGKNIRKINVPAFFDIFTPLVKSYITIRWAKLVNDRRLTPLFKFDPVVDDEISRLRCDVITSRVEHITRQYSYFEVLKQIILRVLLYGEVLQFPVEEWHQECQEISKDSPIKGEPIEDGNTQKVVTKEGIRYHLPHPTRYYYDRGHYPHTLNSGTGCQYSGYWRVLKYSDLLGQKAYYNLDRIGYESFGNWFKGKRDHGYWTNMLKGCTLNFPTDAEHSSSVSQFDTEKSQAKWYSRDWADKPIVVTEHFEWLVPKDWDLGDYEYPVPFRFVIAADDEVIYCAPVAYNPTTWYAYDWAEGRTHNASMALEVLPFQDQFSNLMAQYLLTIRQNLNNISFVDTDLLDEKDIEKIENWGEKLWRSINLVKVSFRKMRDKFGSQPERAIVGHKLPYQDANQLLNGMKVILDTLERVLVMSAQEVGQAASHEQTREEIRHINANTSSRVVFTGVAIDQGIDAWKRQIYNGLMAYGQPDFYAQVAMDQSPESPTAALNKDALEKLGFTAEGKYDEKRHKQYLKANKTAIAYESFSSDREGDERRNNAEMAQAMVQLLDTAMKYPQIAQSITPDQLIDMVNKIGQMGGLPRDFKLVASGEAKDLQSQIQEVVMQLREYIDQSLQAQQQDTKGALTEIMTKNQEQDQGLQQLNALMQQLTGVLKGAQGLPTPQLPAPAESDIMFPGA